MATRIRIDDPAPARLAAMLARHGYRTRVTGGAVRDIVSGHAPKDIDLATDALPGAVAEIAEVEGVRWIPTGLSHGTVTLVVGSEPYEVTTLRRDVACDGRHAEVEFSGDFKEDAARRDFTFNAMSAEMDGTVHDYFGGVADLGARRVRFVGRAADRIGEDYLRILRFFRFRLRFGGNEDPEALEAISRGAAGLGSVSVERVWSELSRMVSSPQGVQQLRLMDELGVCAAVGFRPAHHDEAAAVAARGGTPAAVLGVLSASAGLEPAERWKLSNREESEARAAASVFLDRNSDPAYWRRRVADGLSPDVAAAVLAATGREAAAAAALDPVPAFPLRGADLIAAGAAPGPGMGRALAAAREAWLESGFRTEREGLLETALRTLGSEPGTVGPRGP